MKIINAAKTSELIILKDEKWLANQRIAGKIAADTLTILQNLVKNKTCLSLIELNSLAEEYIISKGAEPTFKGYKGFPAGVCISVNNQLVHGIPTNYKLKDGDIVSFDLGATYNGAIADTAITCIYGNPLSTRHVEMLEVTQQALTNAINSIKVGNRLGTIGNSIYKTITNKGFEVINNYGGHGICMTKNNVGIPHAAPFVANKASINEGVRICAGMVLAIEPMAVIGPASTTVDSDGWTVLTKGLNCHFEHSMFIHNDHVEVVTSRGEL